MSKVFEGILYNQLNDFMKDKLCNILNNDNNNNNNNNNINNNSNKQNRNNNYPELLKYQVDVRRGVAMRLGQVGIFSLGW